MAFAMMVPTRLWLGGAVSQHRDKKLIQQVADGVRRGGALSSLLLAVDGLASYVGAFRRAFRSPLPRRGQGGRSRLLSWPDIAIVQVVKRRSAGEFRIDRRIVQGSKAMIERLLGKVWAATSSTPRTLSGSTAHSASVFPTWLVVPAIWPVRPRPLSPVCISSVVPTISATPIKVCVFASPLAAGAFVGFSALRLSLPVSPTIFGP